MESAVDPWYWTIDQVVNELCFTQVVWKDHPNAPLPDLAVFAQILRKEQIDGVTLLSGFTNEELKNDLNVGSLGQRRSIIRLIGRLRDRSKAYYAEQAHSHDVILSSKPPTGYLSNHFSRSTQSTPRIPYSPHPPLIHDDPPYRDSTRTSNFFCARPGTHDTSSTITSLRNSPWQIQGLPGSTVEHKPQVCSPEHPDSMCRDSEKIVEDSSGNNRRRLDLSVAKYSEHVAAPKQAFSAAQSACIPDLWPSSTLINTPFRKSIIMSDESYFEPLNRKKACGHDSKDSSFLGKSVFSPNTIFFGSSGFGKPINPEIEMTPLNQHESFCGDSAGSEFSFHTSDASVYGRQAYVNRRMMYFLRTAGENEVISSDTFLLQPYPLIAALPESSRSSIIIQSKDNCVTATREKTSAVGLCGDDKDGASDTLNNEWDYLLSRWGTATDDRILSLDDLNKIDSDSDEEEHALEQELLEEEQRATKNALDPLEVSDLVDVAIAEYISIWDLEKRPIRLEKAFSIWKKGKSTRGRGLLISAGKHMVQQFTQRLETLKDNIVKDVWYHTKKVRAQCESLEQTVIQREEERINISIWQSLYSPLQPKTKLRTRKRRELHQHDPDEHALSSDDEIVDNSDFVEALNVEGLPLIDLTMSSRISDGEIDDDTEDECACESSDHDENLDIRLGKSRDSSKCLESGSVIGDTTNIPHIKSESSATVTKPPTMLKYIDLTADSDLDVNYVTQHPNNSLNSPVAGRPSRSRSINILDILSHKWDDIEDKEDRKLLVKKLLLTLPAQAYTQLRIYVLSDRTSSSSFRILELAENVVKVLKKEMKVEVDFQLEMSAFRHTRELLRLYVCWLELKAKFFRKHYQDPAITRIQLAELPHRVMATTLSQVNGDRGEDINHCLGFIIGVLEQHEYSLAESYGGEQSADGSQFTPNRQRKRPVAESQAAIERRDNVKRARKTYDDRVRVFLEENQSQHSNELEGMVEGVVVNIGKQKDEAAISIPNKLSIHSRPHQTEGIRFMWREIVGTSDNNKDLQGCLLAHTMGLGKTYQVISFLATLAHAVRNAEDSIIAQIPNSLHEMRVLVLCPAGLIENWKSEFDKWCGSHTNIGEGKPWAITSDQKHRDRLKVLEDWYERTGVLLMSYGLFKIWALNKHGSRSRLTEDQYKSVRKWLLDGPSIVVADEAHTLKNRNSDIAKAAKMLRTTSRIALTGTPLSNNVAEYFAMVDWIAHGYLGEVSEFNANYKEPIEDGLQSTSSIRQRRTALMKLFTLTQIIDPKIHRKEVKDLEGGLGSKTEFVLKIPLTDVQFEAYKSFVVHARKRGIDFNNAALWAWIGRLQLLCNHPMLFLNRLESPSESLDGQIYRSKNPVKRFQESQTEGDSNGTRSPLTSMLAADMEEVETEDPTTVSDPITEQVSENVADELADIFDHVRKVQDPTLYSRKVNILLQILARSKELGDRVLVFSQSIPTLRFLEKILMDRSLNVLLMTGNTTMLNRQRIMKDVNDKTRPCDVFLISTRAGGVGINLHGANRVVLFDFSFNPTWEQQAIGRAYRLGQKKPVFVYRLISTGCFEEQLLNQSNFKTQLAFHVVEKKNMRSKASKEGTRLELPLNSRPDDNLFDYVGYDRILDTILQNMKCGDEIVHQVTLAEILREEVLDELTEEDRKEAENNLAMEKLRLANPITWQTTQNTKKHIAGAHGVSVLGKCPALPVSDKNTAETYQKTVAKPLVFDTSSMGLFGPIPHLPTPDGLSSIPDPAPIWQPNATYDTSASAKPHG